MRFKRAMAASMAAVMAVSSAVVCQVTASAAAVEITSLPYKTDSTDDMWYEKYYKVNADSDILKVDAEKASDAYFYFLYTSQNPDAWCSQYEIKKQDDTWTSLTKVVNMPTASSESVALTPYSSDYASGIYFTGWNIIVPEMGIMYKLGSDSASFSVEDDPQKEGDLNLTIPKGTKYVGIKYNSIDTTKWGSQIEIYNKDWKSVTGCTNLSIAESDGERFFSVDGFTDQAYKIKGFNVNVTGVVYYGDIASSEVPVSDVTIATPEKTTYNVGDEVTLTASVNEDATVEDKDIVWSSDDTDVATVDETTGKVTFVGAGNVTVTAAYKSDKTIKDTVALKAEKKKVTANVTAGAVTDALVDNAEELAKKAVTVDAPDLKTDDYKVSVSVDGKKYTATVELTEEAAKKYELTTNTASGNIAYKVTGLKLSNIKLSIPVTSTAGVKITATIQPEDLADGEVEWSTADNTVATVEDGLVKPVSGSAGNKTTITATVKGTTISADCEVEIVEHDNPATAIKLDKSELSGTAGDKAELKADVTAKDDTKECTDVVIWESSDEKVATVNAGSVTFVGEGTAEITATAGDVHAVCKVTVKAKTIAVEKVTLDKTSAELTVGDTATLKATVTPDNATDKTVTWTSSDESVATVKDGVVTAKKAGKAVITAKAGDKTAECTVTVKAKEEKPEEKPDPAPSVNEKEIWSGSTDLGTDWGKSVTVPKADVKIGDTIRIKVSTGSAEYHQVKIMDSSWNVLSSLKSKADAQYGTITVDKDGYVEFKVNAADAKLIREGGLIISGYDLTVSAVSSRAMKDETLAPSTKVYAVVNNKPDSQIAILAISEEDAEKYKSYTVTITRGSDGKKVEVSVEDCYKYVSYNKDGEDVRVSGDGAYYIMLDITGIEDSFNGITVKIVPTVPKG